MKNEVWCDIEGYEGMYQVSDKGRVKSLKYGKEKILKPGNNGNGYFVVNLWKNGKQKMYKVHRLVGQAFLLNPKNLPQINHKDEDKTNNNVENLEFCDRKYNCNYGTRTKRQAEKISNGNIKIEKKMILKLHPYPCTLILKLVKSLPENVGGLVENNEGYITMRLTLKDWQSYFVHESVHVVQAVENYIENKLDDESEAYLLQYITENIKQYITKNARKYVISKRINKNGRKRKNKTTKNLQQKLRSTSSLQEIHKGRSRKSN